MNDADDNGMGEFVDDSQSADVRTGAASTVLALAENLQKIVDRSAVIAAQDVECAVTRCRADDGFSLPIGPHVTAVRH